VTERDRLHGEQLATVLDAPESTQLTDQFRRAGPSNAATFE